MEDMSTQINTCDDPNEILGVDTRVIILCGRSMGKTVSITNMLDTKPWGDDESWMKALDADVPKEITYGPQKRGKKGKIKRW